MLPGYGSKQYQGKFHSYVSKQCSSSEVSILVGDDKSLMPLPSSVFAFYGRSKTLLAFIVTLFVAEMAAQVAIIAVTVPSIEIIPSPLPSTLDANACIVRNIPSLFPSFWYGQSPAEDVDRLHYT